MKARLALVVGLILVTVWGLSALGEEQTGTISANVSQKMQVTFTDELDLGDINGDYNGINIGEYLELTVQSNVDYYVQLSCSGNMRLVNAPNDEDWRWEIETEYAIWKEITWHDHHSQQPGGAYPDGEHYEGYVQALDYSQGGCYWYDVNDPAWWEAELGGGKQGGNTNEDEALDFNAIDRLPEHYDGYTAAVPGWDDDIYNYGADLTLRFYPYLDIYEGYGTMAGSYEATITVVVTSANWW